MILGSAHLQSTRQFGSKLFHPWAIVTTIPGYLKPTSRDPETETGNLQTEKRVHRIHGTLETDLQRMLRSLVAPTREAGGFHLTMAARGWGDEGYQSSCAEGVPRKK